MKRRRWILGAVAVAGVVALVVPAVGQGNDASSTRGLLPAGSLDPSFGSGGIVAHVSSGGITGIAIQPDGRIVVVGGSTLARYLEDGSPDPSFGAGGYVQAAGSVRAVALQPDGKIVVAGTSLGVFMVARYTADGAPDTSFGTDGVTTTNVDPPTASSAANALEILPGGKILAAGTVTFPVDDTYSPDYTAWALARYSSDGSIDPTFGAGGIVQNGFFFESNYLDGVVVLPSGNIVVTGSGDSQTHGQDSQAIELADYLPNGAPNRSFGTRHDGTVTNLGPYCSGSSALQQGKIVVVGQYCSASSKFLAVLAGYTKKGRLDHSLGPKGLTKVGRISPHQTSYVDPSVVTQPDGKLLIAVNGYVLRLLPNRQMDTTFGTGGVVPLGDIPSSLALQADGNILVGGKSGSSWTLSRLIGGS